MKSRQDSEPGMADLHRQTGEVMSPWFASRTADPPPPSIVEGVQTRIPTTRRRSSWRIPDWWLWRRGNSERAGFLLATATSVLILGLIGLTSAGVFMVAVVDEPAPLQEVAAAPVASVDDGSEVEVDAVTKAPTAAMWATKVGGTVAQAPTVINVGTSGTSPNGFPEINGIETEAVVEFDDSRLSGVENVVRNERHIGADGEGTVATGVMQIENEGGSWVGTFESATPPGRGGPLRAVELAGTGDYASLSAFLHYDLARGWGDPEMISGIVAPIERPTAAARAGLNEYANNYKLPEDILTRHKLREAEPSVQEGLPVAVAGHMEQTYEWISDHALFDEVPPELKLVPEFTVADLRLDDPRLQLEDYEVLLNTNYYDLLENGSLSAGLSRGRNEEGGGWNGSVRGFTDPDEPVLLAGRHYVTTLTGTGAYEGLSAVLFNTPDPADEDDLLDYWTVFDSWSVEGVLFAGGLPPYPAVP